MSVIRGNNSANTIIDNNRSNSIFGYGGNDHIEGRGGNDTIYGGHDNDTILGGTGADTLYGEWGDDRLEGGDGNDILHGGDGADALIGGKGNDTLFATTFDALVGDAGNDTFVFEVGGALPAVDPNDHFVGGTGTDTFRFVNNLTDENLISKIVTGFGGASAVYMQRDGLSPVHSVGNVLEVEKIEAGGKNSLIFDGRNDTLTMSVSGSTGEDQFIGGRGNETFDGKGGHDTFIGGGGTNTFISDVNDSDTFNLSLNDGFSFVKGFNGAGTNAGDTVVIDRWDGAWTDPNAYTTNHVEINGHTIFQLQHVDAATGVADTTATLDIVGTGLVEWVDYFWV